MIFIQKVLLLFIMLFCHIVDDYYLQGCLADLKQRRWWEKKAPDAMYRKDYVMALFEHAFSWAFMVSLPLLITSFLLENAGLAIYVACMYPVNTFIHAIIDDAKANQRDINLVTDQLFHFGQILITWIFAVILL